MTDTADPTMLGVDDRPASVRSVFGVEPRTSTFPPPQASMPIVPALPRIAPAAPGPAVHNDQPFEFSAVSAGSPRRAPRQQRRAGGGHGSGRFLLAALGHRVRRGNYGRLSERRGQADSEPEAPCSLRPGAVAACTATFVSSLPRRRDCARHEVTITSRPAIVLIDRTTGPDIEMLGVRHGHLRLVDQPDWSMPHGDFVSRPGQRQQFIRTVDSTSRHTFGRP
jgi:hypothetical protein